MLINVSKQLLDSPELAAIGRLDGDIRGYLYRLCLPSMMKSGVYLLPVTLIEEVEAKLQSYKRQREYLIAQFIGTYAAAKAEAETRLRGVYDESDYKPAERVQAAFVMDWQYVSFATPGKLANISASFFEQEKAKMAGKIAEATDEVRQVLRAAMQEMVGHMVDRLSPAADGSKKIFRNTCVENLAEFLRTFDARNITGDDDLKALTDRAACLLQGIDAGKLRDSEPLRAGVQSSMAEIKAKLDTMLVVDGAKRMISFDE